MSCGASSGADEAFGRATQRVGNDEWRPKSRRPFGLCLCIPPRRDVVVAQSNAPPKTKAVAALPLALFLSAVTQALS